MIDRPGVPRVTGWLGVPCLLACLSCAPVFAQAPGQPALRPGRFVVGAGLVLSGGYPIGDAVAELRTNATGAAPPPFTWFAAASRVRAAPGTAVRIEYALTKSVAIEGGGSFAQPVIGVSLSQDPEATALHIDGETLHQIVIEGGASWQLPWRLGGRVAPFVAGGAGYLRQLHEERTLVETGQVYSAGGGARYFLRGGSAALRPVGVRADLRAVWRRRGIDFANRTRVSPSATIALFVGL